MRLTIRIPFGGNWRSRHYGLPAITGVAIATAAMSWDLPPSADTWQAHVTYWTALPLVGAGLFLTTAHDTGALCERCGVVPDDVEERARRRRPLLAWEHAMHGTRRRYRASHTLWYALVGASLLVPHGAWSRVASTAALAWILAELWATRVHNRLGPWCPWCRGGGDDDTEAAPTPSPSTYQPA
ncbi:hypothetical protein ACWGCW_28130 [Streptomyces sp. NPDC054933]